MITVNVNRPRILVITEDNRIQGVIRIDQTTKDITDRIKLMIGEGWNTDKVEIVEGLEIGEYDYESNFKAILTIDEEETDTIMFEIYFAPEY